MSASAKEQAGLAFVAHVIFCEACTTFGVLAPVERRRELGLVAHAKRIGVYEGGAGTLWRCDEGVRLAKEAEQA